jgi:hypothetical protein
MTESVARHFGPSLDAQVCLQARDRRGGAGSPLRPALRRACAEERCLRAFHAPRDVAHVTLRPLSVK